MSMLDEMNYIPATELDAAASAFHHVPVIGDLNLALAGGPWVVPVTVCGWAIKVIDDYGPGLEGKWVAEKEEPMVLDRSVVLIGEIGWYCWWFPIFPIYLVCKEYPPNLTEICRSGKVWLCCIKSPYSMSLSSLGFYFVPNNLDGKYLVSHGYTY